ncbi:NAD(P)/FAD-dependent oxidoreductase [Ancylobacter radicis]|uniref:NAD(P)/FAD-dependent oxidoreductase n=1 Tax=Ancylobacter radicis TaxID=2836179 RepID=A0ABS5RBK1_9HYPH|nr:FAD-dependent oxidoreductase [Ancylobacter radicis]MBS9479034.1 NAD(P)/FAD-dependent oxidoreductase [Ancylobacter radicis]
MHHLSTPPSRERLLVIGNGMAGIRLVEEVLERAPDRFDITILGAEPRPAYNRILLSPVLAGERVADDILIHEPGWYARHGVTLHTGVTVQALQPEARRVVATDGRAFTYDRLVLATGSDPVVPPLPGVRLPGVVRFRDVEDVTSMLAQAGAGRRAVVIGGGLLGLEAAYGLVRRGMAVTVLHLMPHLMERQLDAEAAGLLRGALEARGIAILTGAATQEITGTDHVTGVRLVDGQTLPADLVVLAIGVRPRVELPRAAGLEIARGIVVDDALCTSRPGIYALGECAEHRGICHGLVAPLYEMARALATHLAGEAGHYVPSPTATRLKVTGIDLFSAGDFAGGPGSEDIVLRDPRMGHYARLVVRDDRLVGAVLCGDTTDAGFFFDLIQSGRDIDPIRDTLIFGPALCAAA